MFQKCLKEPLFILENEFNKKPEDPVVKENKEAKKKKKDDKDYERFHSER